MGKKKKILYIILLYTICAILVSCGNTKKNQTEGSQNQQKKEVPNILTQIEEETEKLIQDLWYKKSQLNAKGQVVEEPQDEGQEKDQAEKKESSEKEGESSGKENGSEEKDSEKKEESESKDSEQKQEGEKKPDEEQSSSEGGGEEETKNGEEEKLKSWDDIKGSIEKLHIDWNSYEPDARKDGATQEMLGGAKAQLNILTENIETENVDTVLQETNKLYAYLPQFFNLYRHNAPPEIKKIKAITRQIILNSDSLYWDNMNELLDEIKNTWLTAKSRMEHVDRQLNEMIDYAIDDLAEVVNSKKSSLVRLKGDILLQNLEQIK